MKVSFRDYREDPTIFGLTSGAESRSREKACATSSTGLPESGWRRPRSFKIIGVVDKVSGPTCWSTGLLTCRVHLVSGDPWVPMSLIVLIQVPIEKKLADILTKLLDQAIFAHLRGELWVVFPFWDLVGRADVNMHVAFSFIYHIMLASLYRRLHLYRML
jgi:hypothetical protein